MRQQRRPRGVGDWAMGAIGLRVCSGIIVGLSLLVLGIAGCSSNSSQQNANDPPPGGSSSPSISGALTTSAGTVPSGETVTLTAAGVTPLSTTPTATGNYSFKNLPAGTYNLLVMESFSGIPVQTELGPISVQQSAIMLPTLMLPTAAQVAAVGMPAQGALLVFGVNAQGTLMPVSAQVEGVANIYGPGTPALVPAVPAGSWDVAVTDDNSIDTFIGVSFQNGTISVVNAYF